MLEKTREFIKMRRGTIQPIVHHALDKLVNDNPSVSKVYLIGSYANGDWIDADTPQWFREFRQSYKPGESDVDFYTEPLVELTEDYDIVPHLNRGNNILIYDNGKTKI